MDEISCADCQEELSTSRLDSLSRDKRAAFEEHINKCTECSLVREEYRKVDVLVRNVLRTDFSLGMDFWQKVEQREQEETLQTGLQDEPELFDTKVYPKAAIIGLGGTGKEVVRCFKRERLTHGLNLPIFQCLVIDTIKFEEPLDMDPRMRLDDEECLYIGGYDPGKILKDLDHDSPIKKWWGKRADTKLMRVEKGAGQRRSVGRMGFFNSFQKIKAELWRMVQQFTIAENLSQAIGEDYKNPIIYLVFSLCGGTGSGLFFDVAYVLRELFKSSDHPPTIVALATLPGLYSQSINSIPQRKRLQANTYAALAELNHLHMMALDSEHKYLWKVQYNEHFTVESENLPFDYIYLIENTDAHGRTYDRQLVFEQMSRAIFWLSEPAIRARFWERANNLNNRRQKKSAYPEQRPPIYSALGVSTVKFDRQCGHLLLDLEHMGIKRIRKTSIGKSILPPYLQTDIALIEEMSREQSGVSPFPIGSNELLLIGTFGSRAEVSTTLKRIYAKYEAALRKLPTSPMWLRRREQLSINTLNALSKCVLEAFYTSGATAVLETLKEIYDQLLPVHRGIDEKIEKQRRYKSQIEKEFLNAFLSKMYTPEPTGTLIKHLKNLLNLVDVVYAPDLTKQTEKAARQLYQWYDTSSRVIIYGDIVQSLLDPLLNYVEQQRQGFLDIERYLNIWLKYNQLADPMQPHMQHIYPRFRIHDQQQLAIPRYKLNLYQDQLLLDDEFNDTGLKQMAIEKVSIEEHLVERLLSAELATKQWAFIDRAEYLWNFSHKGNEEMILELEWINLLGFGIDPQSETSQHVGSDIQTLIRDLPFHPEPVATARRDEMVLLKTLHGLTSSSIRSFEGMQDAYEELNPYKERYPVRGDPYLHLSCDWFQPAGTGPTPQDVIETWEGMAELLAGSRKLTKKLSIAVKEYRLASTLVLQEVINVDRTGHPFFDFVISLQAILEPRASYPLQVQKALAEMEEMLRKQGWEKFETKPNDAFNPKWHNKDEPFLDEEDKDNDEDEWASVTESGHAFLKRIQRERTLRVIEVIRPGYVHLQTRKVRHALVIVSAE